MFTNKKDCTIFEKLVKNRSPTFVRHEMKNIYWEDVKSQKISGTQGNNYRISQNEVLIFIPENSLTDYVPKVGDKIIEGLIFSENPPENVMTIMTVKNFLYGSATVRHLEVTAE